MLTDIHKTGIALLNQTLACTVDVRFQVKHAAWNVKGHVFVQLRALFETIVLALNVHIDLVAARIAMLGGVVRGTVRTAATPSTLPEYPGDLVTGDAHVLARGGARGATLVRQHRRRLRDDTLGTTRAVEKRPCKKERCSVHCRS
jgi:DNA-binding ferritin-like protein